MSILSKWLDRQIKNNNSESRYIEGLRVSDDGFSLNLTFKKIGLGPTPEDLILNFANEFICEDAKKFIENAKLGFC